MNLSELTPDPRNANKGTERGRNALEHSLRSYGAGRSILLDKHGTIIAGNKTAETAADIGIDEVVVVETDGNKVVAVKRTDLDLAKDPAARELAYADNRVSELDLDFDPQAILTDLQEGVSLENLWSQAELDQMLKDLTPPTDAPEAQTDRAAELQEKWQTERGQVWEIGRHRLMCGDSTSQEDFKRLMQEDVGQMIFTDPPYGVGYDGGAKKRNKLDGDHVGTDIYAKALPVIAGVVDKKAPLYLWYADGHAAAAAAAAAGYEITAQIIWAKNHAQFVTSAHYKGKHEPCYYAHKKGQSARWHGQNNEVTLWEYDRASSNTYHPTQKPIELATRAIGNSTESGHIVVDAFLGSGSTMVAAEQLNRTCYGMEIDPGYCGVVLERMSDTGLDPTVIERDN